MLIQLSMNIIPLVNNNIYTNIKNIVLYFDVELGSISLI